MLRGPLPLFAFPPIPAEAEALAAADELAAAEGDGASEMKAWAASRKSGDAETLVPVVMRAAAAARRKLVDATMLSVFFRGKGEGEGGAS